MAQLNLDGKKVLVLGLGHFGGGVGVTRFLVRQGAQVTVTDLAGGDQLSDSLHKLADLPITFHLNGHRREDIEEADYIVANPAIPRHSGWIRAAQELDVPLTSEMNLFFERCLAPLIGVTGSNGKSTTASMIAHALRESSNQFRKIWLGGNIGGDNLLERVEEIQSSDVVVLELSSFQLFDLGSLRRSPHIAVVTNIAPNHLDWHGSMDAYVAAKKNILLYQGSHDHAVLNGTDKEVRSWEKAVKGKVHFFDGQTTELQLAVPGQHNQANAAAAMKVASILELPEADARASLQTYSALAHRLEEVAEIDGVCYFNDSIATTPESTMAAIAAFDKPKVLILGGYDKQIAFEPLVRKILADELVHGVICMGQVRSRILELFRTVGDQVACRCESAQSLEEALALAQRQVQPGWIVLFSPACASYDMFRNFRDRGNRFRQLVLDLKRGPIPFTSG